MIRPIWILITILFMVGFGILAAVQNSSGVPVSSKKEITDTIDLSLYDEYESAVFAGGCFWGVEFFFEQQEGVVAAFSGYTGGKKDDPSYQDVLTGRSGHVEAVIIFYDPEVTDYRTLATYFFEIHDPEQKDGQGPDIGNQYLSVIFYDYEVERETAHELVEILEAEGYEIATTIQRRSAFWPAENYHQDYYERKRALPYCHIYTPRFP